MAVLIVEAVADCRNRVMFELGEGIGFARKVFVGLDPLLRIDEVVDHLLDGAWAVGQALVARQINHPHPATADQTLDEVALLQQRAPLERARQGCGGWGRWFFVGHRCQPAKITITDTLSVPPPPHRDPIAGAESRRFPYPRRAP